jgi:hypothetical protein
VRPPGEFGRLPAQLRVSSCSSLYSIEAGLVRGMTDPLAAAWSTTRPAGSTGACSCTRSCTHALTDAKPNPRAESGAKSSRFLRIQATPIEGLEQSLRPSRT